MAMWGGAALAAGPGWKRKMSQDQLCGTKVAYESLRCQTYSGWEKGRATRQIASGRADTGRKLLANGNPAVVVLPHRKEQDAIMTEPTKAGVNASISALLTGEALRLQ